MFSHDFSQSYSLLFWESQQLSLKHLCIWRDSEDAIIKNIWLVKFATTPQSQSWWLWKEGPFPAGGPWEPPSAQYPWVDLLCIWELSGKVALYTHVAIFSDTNQWQKTSRSHIDICENARENSWGMTVLPHRIRVGQCPNNPQAQAVLTTVRTSHVTRNPRPSGASGRWC